MATVDVGQFKYASRRSKYVVTKYIRDHQILLSSKEKEYHIIPAGIVAICILFFDTANEIDIKCSSKNINIDGNRLSVTYRNYNFVYFKNVISSDKHIWTFKISKIATKVGNHDFFIGIHNELEGKDQGWGYRPAVYLIGVDNHGDYDVVQREAEVWTNHYRTQIYGKCLQHNDTVTMCLDLDRLELRFIINNIDYGVAYKVKKGRYRPVIMMYDIGDTIELL